MDKIFEEKAQAIKNSIVYDSKDLEKTVSELSEQVEQYKIQNQVLTNVVTKFSDMMSEMESKINNLETNNFRRMAVISGFYGDDDKEKCIRELERFFDFNLGLKIDIEDLFTVGQNVPPNIVFTVSTLKQKKQLIKMKSLLKGVRNESNKSYFVSEYYSASHNEQRKRERDIVNETRRGMSQSMLSSQRRV